ncbi:HD domain-containing protein [Aestuariivirga litoralis]|uniref:HD domain-containing protein n=1 Tax=Aestuariivirga litoralis TaxID=2650924 RepID=UPI0018C45888|nr:HD domain-containing protein [Aestuariivirga litoralis]MBG1231547.1 HD domain-containing protein [Aestuariivirga litoralis]
MEGVQQRIRDPIHDLIVFEGPNKSQLEGALWKVLQTRPFQRLRRIKQLGFSDFVYPGATHSRFAHSVGVFHTARMLMEIVHRHTASRQDTRENHALAAALVHDVGHGPFSHAFEKVGGRLNLKLANHELLSEELIRRGEIAETLNHEMGKCFSDDVADIIKKNGVKTVHHAVVSSQFDADRLDYMRRDRFMTGSQHAGIDFQWLLANLEIRSVETGVDDQPTGSVETFVIGPKAVHAAEAFVLGLFQLYPTVYFHKATRGAEKLFEELLVRVITLVQSEGTASTGLFDNHPIVRFAKDPESAELALMLDDTVVWGALPLMIDASDKVVAHVAARLRDRKLLKCYDVRERIALRIDPKSSNMREKIDQIDKCCASVKVKLTGKFPNGDGFPKILFDEDERSPYRSVDRSKGPLNQIMVRSGDHLVDLNERSSVVSSLKVFKLFRAYFSKDDPQIEAEIDSAMEEGISECR